MLDEFNNSVPESGPQKAVVNQTTLVMAYYRNPGMLKKHYELWKNLLPELKVFDVVIVDDGSPADVAAFAPPADLGIPVKIYRMLVDIRWGQDIARNVGAEKAAGPWLLLTDMDHMVTPELLETVLYGKVNPNRVYRFTRVSAPDMLPYKLHPNSWLLTRQLYRRVGGYDERFAGWYGTDADFRDRLALVAPLLQLKVPLIRVPREVIPDASTTCYARKTMEDSVAIRRIKKQRLKSKQMRPVRKGFPYERVF